MAGSILVDTNVLVYSVDIRDLAKLERARKALDALRTCGRLVLSQQVLSEFARVTTERIPRPLTAGQATARVGEFARSTRVLPVTPAVIAEALGVAERTGRSFWEAQLIATARVHGVATIVSEDFEDGAVCEGVRFVDPFAEGFDVASLGT
ncbi:MAG: PIN domain-containing protein [Actinomycetota bacterium]|nr:PIN domain-containing protein [Actinomycetota bacterium]